MRARAWSAEAGRVARIDAETHPGLPCLALVDVDDHEGATVQRVRAALGRCGVQLEPAERRVRLHGATGPGLDLAIVAALLAAHRIVPTTSLSESLIWGGLADDGTLAAIPALATLGALALASGLRRLVVPASAGPIDTPDSLVVVRVVSVAELVTHLRGELPIGVDPWQPPAVVPQALARVRGALELMLAGQHHTLVRVAARESSGVLRWLAAMLPQPDETLAAERLALGSVGVDPLARVHVLEPGIPISRVLGEHPAAPGPACLAHGGVLVLDDARRYPPRLLEQVHSVTSGERRGPRPSDFAVLATLRPRGRRVASVIRPCSLSWLAIVAPQTRASSMQALDSAARVRARITMARARQLARFGGSWPALAWTCNARIPKSAACLDEFCPTSESGRALLAELTRVQRLGWSSDYRADLLRVARTVADLDPDRDPSAPLDRECIATAAIFVPGS